MFTVCYKSTTPFKTPLPKKNRSPAGGGGGFVVLAAASLPVENNLMYPVHFIYSPASATEGLHTVI